MHCGYFDTTRNDNHSSLLTPRVVGGRHSIPSEICAQNDPPFEKRRLRPISNHNVSTVRDSENNLITTNIKSTTSFPTSHRWSAYVTPKCPKGWLKERFFRFLSKSQRLIVSGAVNLVRRYHKHLMVGGNVYRIDGRDLQLGRVEEIV